MAKLVDHRPANALTSRDELQPGMEVWSTHFCDEEPQKLVLATGAIPFEELEVSARIGPSPLDGSWWFKCRYGDADAAAPPHEDSCADRSLDGNDYNGNYLFRTEADARAWLAETYPLYRPEPFYWDDAA